LLVIDPDCLYKQNVLIIKKLTNASKSIIYMWDSIENRRRAKNILDMFDVRLSFDPVDSMKYNMIFRPLFYTSNVKNKETVYDISFVGTGHSDRVGIIEKINKQCNEKKLICFFYLYLQSPIVFYFYKIVKKCYRKIKKSYFRNAF